MSSVKWKVGLTLTADVDSVRDYTCDFSEWLDGETIANVVIIGTNCTATLQSQTATTAKFRVSVVAAGASVRVRITTSSGQVEDFSIGFAQQTR